jgi:hypothetical protein
MKLITLRKISNDHMSVTKSLKENQKEKKRKKLA